MKEYQNILEPITDPLPLLADYPEYVEPLHFEKRYKASPIVDEDGGDLFVRSWRYWYNARGIIEMENRLVAKATAIINVHPWGVDDWHGLKSPEPAGIALFCTKEKNLFAQRHVRDVINPFLRYLRDHVAVIGHSMPGIEDDIRKLVYPSISTKLDELNIEKGEKLLAELLNEHSFTANPLIDKLSIDPDLPVKSYFDQTPSTDAGDFYNGSGFWQLPMPVLHCLERKNDLVFYDGEGYPKVRDYLKSIGVRHILLAGYCTDMCVISTTCGYNNLSQDFNLFLVGDATLATYPGSLTPKYATQVAIANASLRQMITQVNFVRLEEYFDIVDESCNIIGKATRRECHSNRLLAHCVVHVLVFNNKGELYLQKRSINKDIQPGKWDTSVGGHLNLGESFDQAVYRELKEELGINTPVKHLYNYWMHSPVETEYVSTYTCVYDGDIVFDPYEIDDGRFWSIDEIEKSLGTEVFTPNFEQEFDKWKHKQA
jgi:isopentenyldiphosphate isomerase